MLEKATREYTKEELRKKRRQKERITAFSILGAVVVGVILIIIFLIQITTHQKNNKKVEKEEVKIEEPVVSTNTVSENVSEDSVETVSADTVSQDVVKTVEQLAAEKEEKKAALDAIIKSYLEQMTIEEKVAGLLFVSPEALTGVSGVKIAGSSTSEALSKYAVGGVIYSEANMESEDQFRELIFNTNAFCKRELFFAVSDEGGEKSPFVLSKILEEPIAGEKTTGETGGVAGAYSTALSIGSYLDRYGIGVNLAPVADTVMSESSFIAERSYGSDVNTVSSLVKSNIKGYEDKEINTCLKYFPSYGDANKDPGFGIVKTTRTKDDLAKTEIPIFQEGIEAGADFIMVSHVVAPQISGESIPSCMSKVVVTDIIRNELKFDGVIITDAMKKSAIAQNYKQGDAAADAIIAGCDMILEPSDINKAYQGILSAVQEGTITEERIDESLYRIYRIKFEDQLAQ